MIVSMKNHAELYQSNADAAFSNPECTAAIRTSLSHNRNAMLKRLAHMTDLCPPIDQNGKPIQIDREPLSYWVNCSTPTPTDKD